MPLGASFIEDVPLVEFNNNNNKYISRALTPSVSNLPEAQSAVHVQLKLSKQRNQRRQENKTKTNKSLGWAGKGARSKYQLTSYMLHNPYSGSVMVPML